MQLHKICFPCFRSSLACFATFPNSDINPIATNQPGKTMHYKEAVNSIMLMRIYLSVSMLSNITLLIFPFVILIIST